MNNIDLMNYWFDSANSDFDTKKNVQMIILLNK